MIFFFLLSIRSFGVVLWELLNREIPYKDVDSSAIIWGVGNNSLHLPVPDSCPEAFRILLKQCWYVIFKFSVQYCSTCIIAIVKKKLFYH